MRGYSAALVSCFLVLLIVSSVFAISMRMWRAPVSVRVGPLTPRSSSIILYCNPSQIFIGEKTTICGRLINATGGEGIPNQPIHLYYRPSGEYSWTYITQVYSSMDGSFTYLWDASSTLTPGYYVVNATFMGNNDFDPWTGITDLQVISLTANQLVVDIADPSPPDGARVTPPITFRVRVTCGGLPVQDAYVTFYYGNGGTGRIGYSMTDVNGIAEVKDWDPGWDHEVTFRWWAEAWKTGYLDGVSQKRTLTVVPPSQDDLYIIGVKPVQVIWNAKALVAEKLTVIEATVRSTFQKRVWVEINVTYDFGSKWYLEKGPYNNGTPIEPGINTIYIPGGPVFNETGHVIQPNWPTTPKWLEWTNIGIDNSITVNLDPANKIPETNEDNNWMTTEIKVVESKSLKILIVPVYFPMAGETYFEPEDWSLEINRLFLLGMYPIADEKLEWTLMPAIAHPGIPCKRPFLPHLETWLYVYVARPLSKFARTLGYDRCVIIIQDRNQSWAGIAIGMSYYDRVPVIVVNEQLFIGYLIAHELGHTYYLWHPHDWIPQLDWFGPPVYWAECYWPYMRTYMLLSRTFMSYASRPPEGTDPDLWRRLPVWIDKGRYDSDPKTMQPPGVWWRWNLFDQLTVNPHEKDPETTILLSFTLYKNQTVVIDKPWYIVSSRTHDLDFGSVGNYSIILLNSERHVIGQVGFNASFTYFTELNGTMVEIQTDSLPLIFNIPYVAGTAYIEIRNATGHVLACRVVTSNPPTVKITFPNGGETLRAGNNYTITWEALDLDGDPLTYMVAYSQDGGKTWIPIAFDINQTYYVWDTSKLKGGTNYLVKVIATDGVNTGEDISDHPFSVVVPDIAITKITFSKMYPAVNETIQIYVTIENRGTSTETFEVCVNCTLLSDPLIGTQTITLEPGETITLSFLWTATAAGRYEIKAFTSAIPNDVNPENNTKITYIYVDTSGGSVVGGSRFRALSV